MTTQEISVPEGWPGSNAAYLAFRALVGAGKVPGRDFTYQPPTQGDRLELGVEGDFVFINPPDLAMQVQESFYGHHRGVETSGTDILAKAQLAGEGVSLILLEHDKLIQDPEGVIEKALQYVEV